MKKQPMSNIQRALFLRLYNDTNAVLVEFYKASLNVPEEDPEVKKMLEGLQEACDEFRSVLIDHGVIVV